MISKYDSRTKNVVLSNDSIKFVEKKLIFFIIK